MDKPKIQRLRTLISGVVATRGEDIYKEASEAYFRTVEPAAVVQPVSSKDVAAIVQFAATHEVPFTIKSGGHNNLTGRMADDTLLIDMSRIASVRVVDIEQGLVRVGSGALWSMVANQLEKHGLAISSGDSGNVGIGGLATTTGIDWMVRKYGPTVDNIISAEVVTADGSILEVSDDSHADLFWAIRGGGSNFGIVTHFTFNAYPTHRVTMGAITYPIQEAATIITDWRDVMRQAPEELTSTLTVLPPRADTAASILIRSCFVGSDEALVEDAFAPLLALGQPLHHELQAVPYRDALDDAQRPAGRLILNNICMRQLSGEAIDEIAKICRKPTTPILQIRHVAGAMNKRPAEAMAFSHRDSEVLIVNPTLVSANASAAEINTALTAWRAIEPLGDGCFINFISEDTGAEITRAYLPATLRRLRELKARYDPHNLFRTNYNIQPA